MSSNQKLILKKKKHSPNIKTKSYTKRKHKFGKTITCIYYLICYHVLETIHLSAFVFCVDTFWKDSSHSTLKNKQCYSNYIYIKSFFSFTMETKLQITNIEVSLNIETLVQFVQKQRNNVSNFLTKCPYNNRHKRNKHEDISNCTVCTLDYIIWQFFVYALIWCYCLVLYVIKRAIYISNKMYGFYIKWNPI